MPVASRFQHAHHLFTHHDSTDEWFQHDFSLQDELLAILERQNIKEQHDYNVSKEFIRRGTGFFDEDDCIEDETCEGDERLKQIFYLLDVIMTPKGWKREEAQIKLHKAYVIASLPLIYGKEWDVNAKRVLERFGVTDLKSLVLALYPRRFGKTIAVACFIAVMLCVIPGITISTFSTGM